MPSYRAGEDFGFLEEFLDVVFAKVGLERARRLVEGEDVVRWLQLRDRDEADLRFVSVWIFDSCNFMAATTFCPLLLAALMRVVMPLMFSVSCFARWAFMCISSAMVNVHKFKLSRSRAVHDDVKRAWASPICGASTGTSTRAKLRLFNLTTVNLRVS